MSHAHSHSNTGLKLAWMAFGALALFRAEVAETQERKPLTKPGQTYVGIEVSGCAEQCPSYEIYLFDNGRMKFRPNNKFTSERDAVNRTPYGAQYKQLVEFISSGDLFKEKPACADEAGHTSVTLHSTLGGETRKAVYSLGCPGDSGTATSLITRFVNGSGTWKLINRSWEYWTAEKYDSK